MIFALCSETFAQKFVCNKQNDKWEQYPLSPIEKKSLKIVKKAKRYNAREQRAFLYIF